MVIDNDIMVGEFCDSAIKVIASVFGTPGDHHAMMKHSRKKSNVDGRMSNTSIIRHGHRIIWHPDILNTI
jgi:hypothetical protein